RWISSRSFMSDVPTRLLRETLRSQMTSTGSGCIDAETLARWSEGTLSARERAAAESHASSCARCQALAAAMARTTAMEPRPRSWWRASTFGWLVPLAAAAAALLLWINVPTDRPAQFATIQPVQPASPVVTQPPAATADSRIESKPAGRASDAAVSPRKVAPRRTAKDDEQRARASLEAAAAQSSAAASEQANAAAPPQPIRLPQTSATTDRAMTDRAMFVGAPLMART